MALAKKPWPSGSAIALALACLCQAVLAAAEPCRAGREDVVLSCDFEKAQWWQGGTDWSFLDTRTRAG
jgi:hypothetical protein